MPSLLQPGAINTPQLNLARTLQFHFAAKVVITLAARYVFLSEFPGKAVCN